MAIVWMVAGAALGALSRIEETTAGWGLVSSSTTWLACAFAAGLFAPRTLDAAGGGAVTLTFANLGYCGWAGTFTGRSGRWFELGVVSGIIFGLLGFAARRGHPLLRTGAALVMLGVFVVESAGLRTHALGPGVP